MPRLNARTMTTATSSGTARSTLRTHAGSLISQGLCVQVVAQRLPTVLGCSCAAECHLFRLGQLRLYSRCDNLLREPGVEGVLKATPLKISAGTAGRPGPRRSKARSGGTSFAHLPREQPRGGVEGQWSWDHGSKAYQPTFVSRKPGRQSYSSTVGHWGFLQSLLGELSCMVSSMSGL